MRDPRPFRPAPRQGPSKPVPEGVCLGCGGEGMIGRLLPGDGGYESEPCPECCDRRLARRTP